MYICFCSILPLRAFRQLSADQFGAPEGGNHKSMQINQTIKSPCLSAFMCLWGLCVSASILLRTRALSRRPVWVHADPSRGGYLLASRTLPVVS
jgi:hypothetical protein